MTRMTLEAAMSIARPGLYGAGDGLMLRVQTGKRGVSRRWYHQFRVNGQRLSRPLGVVGDLPLEELRAVIARERLALAAPLPTAPLAATGPVLAEAPGASLVSEGPSSPEVTPATPTLTACMSEL